VFREAGLPPVTVELLLDGQAAEDLSPEQMKLYDALARRLGFADATTMAAAVRQGPAADARAVAGKQATFRTPRAGNNGQVTDQRKRLGMGTPVEAVRQSVAVAREAAEPKDAAAAGEAAPPASKTEASATPVARPAARLAGQPTANPGDRHATQGVATEGNGNTQTPATPQPTVADTVTHAVWQDGQNGLAAGQRETVGRTVAATDPASTGNGPSATPAATARTGAARLAQTADTAPPTTGRQVDGQPQARQAAPRSSNAQAEGASSAPAITAHARTAEILAERVRQTTGREKRPAQPQPTVPRITHAADRPHATRQAAQSTTPQTPRAPQSGEHTTPPAPTPQGPPQNVINAQADAVARRYGQAGARTPDAPSAAQAEADNTRQAAGAARATEQTFPSTGERTTSHPQTLPATLLDTPSTPAARAAMGVAPVEQPPPDGKAVDQVVAAVRFQATASTREMTVQLTPSELGEVRIEIRTDAGGLRGMVQVDNARTLTELQREVPQLMERLEEAGIRVKDLEFQMNDPQRDAQGNPQHGQQPQNAYARFQSNMSHDQRGRTWDADRETESTRGGMSDHDETEKTGTAADGEYVGSDALNVMI
jgi:flagellar hook-length control protein FliK